MPTIQAMIDTILRDLQVAPLSKTVDVVVAGDPAQEVTGIVTTFLATCEVLQQAVDAGANFIITHESPHYMHQALPVWLKDDPVYRAKWQFIADNRLVIWRFHDYCHRHQQDGIVTGVARALGWTDYADPAAPNVFKLPTLPLSDLAAQVSERLDSRRTKVVGHDEMPCSKVALLVGFPGSEWQIKALRGDIDVLVTGEMHEWETCEYVRDAIYQGQSKALIVTGHEVSEEAGMAYLVDWLRPRFPGVPITHIPSGDPFAG
ncbi:MAG: Nif3-like dinuclear metal center hexameric protein [Anaerolineae bacterium]|nr:Nif3-like dinuclear metal center hexameric protein [Anaerolineae bacterium]